MMDWVEKAKSIFGFGRISLTFVDTVRVERIDSVAEIRTGDFEIKSTLRG